MAREDLSDWLDRLADDVEEARAEASGASPAPKPHGTMGVEGREEAGAMTIKTMERRTGATGAHGIYAEAKVAGDVLRGFLAGEYAGTSTLATSEGAKGARWVVQRYEDDKGAQAALTDYFGTTVEVTCVVCELTSVDVDRLATGKMPALIYKATEILNEQEV